MKAGQGLDGPAQRVQKHPVVVEVYRLRRALDDRPADVPKGAFMVPALMEHDTQQVQSPGMVGPLLQNTAVQLLGLPEVFFLVQANGFVERGLARNRRAESRHRVADFRRTESPQQGEFSPQQDLKTVFKGFGKDKPSLPSAIAPGISNEYDRALVEFLAGRAICLQVPLLILRRTHRPTVEVQQVNPAIEAAEEFRQRPADDDQVLRLCRRARLVVVGGADHDAVHAPRSVPPIATVRIRPVRAFRRRTRVHDFDRGLAVQLTKQVRCGPRPTSCRNISDCHGATPAKRTASRRNIGRRSRRKDGV